MKNLNFKKKFYWGEFVSYVTIDVSNFLIEFEGFLIILISR